MPGRAAGARGHGGLGAEGAAHVVVIDELVGTGVGPGRGQAFLDLGLGNASFLRNVLNRSLRHSCSILPRGARRLNLQLLLEIVRHLDRGPQPSR